MLCFRDKTFCGSACANFACHRYFGPKEKAEAARWWGGDGAPVAFGDYAASGCPDYQPKKEPTNG